MPVARPSAASTDKRDEFRFDLLPVGGYKVYNTDGTYLGDVKKAYRGGWSSRVPEDDEPTHADRPTRYEAAKRLVLIRSMRVQRAEEDRGVGVPDGYELVEVGGLRRRDVVRTPMRFTRAGNTAAWSQPRSVCESRTQRKLTSVSYDRANPHSDRFSYMVADNDRGRMVARRIETAESLAAAAAEAARHHFSAAMADFDFMELLDFVCRVQNEHSATYAFANWTWTFDAPELNERASSLPGMLDLEREQHASIERFWRSHPGELAHAEISTHTDEIRHRKDHAALWAARRQFDDYFYTVETPDRAEQLRTSTGYVFTVYARSEPGGAWTEVTRPIPAA